MNRLKFILIVLIGMNVQAFECVEDGIFLIKHLDQEVKVSNQKFCYQEDVATVLSINCLGAKCDANLNGKTREINPKNVYKVVGSPGHNLCRILGGSPEFITFQSKKGAWMETDRCLFDDGSFSSTDRLFNLVSIK